jgi:hypothetical protein
MRRTLSSGTAARAGFESASGGFDSAFASTVHVKAESSVVGDGEGRPRDPVRDERGLERADRAMGGSYAGAARRATVIPAPRARAA